MESLPTALVEHILDMAMRDLSTDDASELHLPIVCKSWNGYVTRHFFGIMAACLRRLASTSTLTMDALDLVDIVLAYLAGHLDRMVRLPFPQMKNDHGDFNVIIANPHFFGVYVQGERIEDIDVVALYIRNTRVREKAKACYGTHQTIVCGINQDSVDYQEYVKNVDQLLSFREECHQTLVSRS